MVRTICAPNQFIFRGQMKLIPDSHVRLWAISVFVFIAIFVCVICNMAIEREMTWMVYPVCSLIFAWGVFGPLIYRGKDGLLISLGLLSTLILPYLLVLEQWTHTGGWFITIAFPIAVFSIIFIWIIYFTIRKTRNPWTASAVIISSGGVLSLFTYLAIILLSEYSMFPWGWISFGSALGLALLLLIAGRIRKEANNNL